ncbi:hypothetical protein ASL20_13570 [Cupriavidus necator]|nr:hypothetical protein ASL20_13570 [Cupriavidus necator]
MHGTLPGRFTGQLQILRAAYTRKSVWLGVYARGIRRIFKSKTTKLRAIATFTVPAIWMTPWGHSFADAVGSFFRFTFFFHVYK